MIVDGENLFQDDYGLPQAVLGFDIPESEISIFRAPVFGSVSGTWESRSDGDFYQVILIAGHTYSIALNGGNDPLVGLFDSALNLVGVDDDSGGGLNSRLFYTATTTGVYYVDATQFQNSSFVNGALYTLQINDLSASNDAIAATIATTSSIAVNGSSQAGTLDFAGDHDWYQLYLTAGQSYVFSLSGGGTLNDAYLELRDATGELVSIDDDGGTGLNASMQFTATTSGAYFLDAQAFGAETGNYTLSAATGPAQNPLDTLDSGFTIGHTNISVYFGTSGQTVSGEAALRSWNAGESAAALAALGTYAAISGLTFTQVGSAAGADFVFMISDLDIGVLGQTFAGPSSQAILEFDPAGSGWSTSGPAAGSQGFATLLHEIGHALGLAHPHYDGGDTQVMQGVLNLFNSYGTFQLNQGVFTTMSYNAGWGAQGGSAVQASPMALDIAAIQARYGTNNSTNSGNTTYTIPDSPSGNGYRAIWDAGGVDTIVYNGTGSGAIDLRAATLQNAVGGGGYVSWEYGSSSSQIYGGFTIAAGVVIENATGGNGSDVITGNDRGLNRSAQHVP